ncbi:MAG: carbohydrate kinase family protein [Methanobacterium sp.]|jgi:sugar/nucleoside kinase (ribokinase family)|nr:carbohydrate kinase family protein [Methanobacterium sp.]
MSVTVLGEAFIDIVIPVKNLELGNTYHKELKTYIGGASNIALQISRIGVPTNYICKIGKDPFGDYLKNELVEKNLNPVIFMDFDHPTGICTSLVSDNGERTMVAMRGANDKLYKKELYKYSKLFLSSRIIFLSGYTFTSSNNLESLNFIVNNLNKKCKIILNPGAPNIISPYIVKWAQNYVDILIMSLEEAKIISGKNKLDDILLELENIAKTNIITLGSEGAIAIENGIIFPVKTKKLRLVDSTGAGDSFISGFIKSRIEKNDLKENVKMGNYMALKFLKEKNELS